MFGLVIALAGCGGEGGDTDRATTHPADPRVQPPETSEATAGTDTDAGGTRAPGVDAGAEREAAEPLVRQLRAVEAGDAREACAQFSPAGRVAFERDLGALGQEAVRCEDVVLDLQVPEGEATGVEIDGDRGTVMLGEELEYEVERVDGSWKLAG